VAVGADDFWGEVFWSAADCPCPIRAAFRKSKVDDFNIAIMVEEEILD
jgi:hypothetical protein